MKPRKLKPWEPNPETILEDLMAIAAGTRRKGDPQPTWLMAKLRAAAAAKRKRLRQEGTQRSLERHRVRQRAKYRPPPGQSVVARALAAMAPGEWYGINAVGRAIGEEPNSAHRLGQTLRTKGWAERADNPAWSTKGVSPWEILAGAVREPKTLFRITPAGMVERDRIARLVRGEAVEDGEHRGERGARNTRLDQDHPVNVEFRNDV